MIRIPSYSPPEAGVVAAVSSTLLVAVLFGAVIGLSQPLFTVAVFGLVASVALLAAPIAGLWLATTLTFLLAGPIQYFLPRLGARLDWAAYLLAGSLFIPALAALAVADRKTHATVVRSLVVPPLVVFLLAAFLSTAVNHGSGFEVIAAIKSFVLFGGLWAFLAIAPIDEKNIRKWLAYILAIGLIQWLPAIYQYIFVRGKRLAANIGDTTEASDAIVGTFPGSLDAGGLSSVLVLFLILLLSGLLISYRENLLSRKRLSLYLAVLAVPVLLTEVKAIFVYLPLALMIIYGGEFKQRPVAFLALAVGTVAVTATLLFAYNKLHWSGRKDDLSTRIEKLFSYSFEEKLGGIQHRFGYMSRREAVEFWLRQGTPDALAVLAGHGIGSSRTQGLALGHAARQHFPMHIDLTGLSLLLWEVGLIGTGAVIGMLLAGYSAARRLAEKLANPMHKSIANTLQVSFMLYLVSIPYRNDIPYAAPMMFMVMASFGLLGWLNRQTVGSR